MKKTYKPVGLQNKQAKTYRKKTLDPRAKLNIMRDADDLENIDDYWRTAESVLKDDTIEIGETSIHRSDCREYPGDGGDSSSQSDTLFDIRSIRESLSAGQKAGLDSSRISLKVSEGEEFQGLFGDECDAFKVTDGEALCEDQMPSDEDIDENYLEKDRKAEQPEAIRERLVSVGNRARQSVSMRCGNPELKVAHKCEGETLYSPEGRGVAMTNISALYKGRSAFEPLVASGKLETAVLFLNSLAFVKSEKAVCNFSVFMIKGAACIEMDQDKIILKRGGICIVEKDTVYSISNSSGTGCTILLTYSLT